MPRSARKGRLHPGKHPGPIGKAKRNEEAAAVPGRLRPGADILEEGAGLRGDPQQKVRELQLHQFCQVHCPSGLRAPLLRIHQVQQAEQTIPRDGWAA